MLKPKKTAAFILSVLLCASAFAPAVSYAENADDEGESIYISESGNEIKDDSEKELTVSGDFSYSLTDDGNACIEMCTSTEKDLVVPDTIDGKKVTYIGKTAFGNDPESVPFETITLPDSVEYISADNPFSYCLLLKEIITGSKNEYYTSVDGVLYSKDMTKLVCYPCAKEGKSFDIDSKVTEIGTSAVFMTLLENITFPSGLTTIGRHAFNSNVRLASADLSNTAVTKIDAFAFSECTSLKDVKLPDTLTDIGGGAFAGCTHITDITLPEGLLSVGQSAFANTGLDTIVVPSSVQDIGYSAFGYKVNEDGTESTVQGFTIVGAVGSAAHRYSTDSDTDYGYKNDFTFMTYDNYEESKELEGLDIKTENGFNYAIVDGNAVIIECLSSDAELNVPAELGGCKVTALYTASFTNCTAESITIPDGVTEVRKGAFYGCQNAVSIKLPQSVKTVGEAAFGNCPKLETVDIGGAETIEKDIFDQCPMLASLTISGNCKNAAEDEPFIEFTNLREINVTEGGNGNFSSVDGVLFSRDMTILFAYPASKEGSSYKIPESVTTVANSAFYHNKYLETIDLTNVQIIGDYAFESCELLKKVIMSKELTALGSDAFYDCAKLKSLRVYDKVETVGAYSFGYLYSSAAEASDDDSDETQAQSNDKLADGFKVYAPKDSAPYRYAKDCGIKAISGSVEINGMNISLPFLIVVGIMFIGLVIAIILAATAKKRKAKKEERKMVKIKADVAEKLKTKKENAEQQTETEEKEDEAE